MEEFFSSYLNVEATSRLEFTELNPFKIYVDTNLGGKVANQTVSEILNEIFQTNAFSAEQIGNINRLTIDAEFFDIPASNFENLQLDRQESILLETFINHPKQFYNLFNKSNGSIDELIKGKDNFIDKRNSVITEVQEKLFDFKKNIGFSSLIAAEPKRIDNEGNHLDTNYDYTTINLPKLDDSPMEKNYLNRQFAFFLQEYFPNTSIKNIEKTFKLTLQGAEQGKLVVNHPNGTLEYIDPKDRENLSKLTSDIYSLSGKARTFALAYFSDKKPSFQVLRETGNDLRFSFNPYTRSAFRLLYSGSSYAEGASNNIRQLGSYLLLPKITSPLAGRNLIPLYIWGSMYLGDWASTEKANEIIQYITPDRLNLTISDVRPYLLQETAPRLGAYIYNKISESFGLSEMIPEWVNNYIPENLFIDYVNPDEILNSLNNTQNNYLADFAGENGISRETLKALDLINESGEATRSAYEYGLTDNIGTNLTEYYNNIKTSDPALYKELKSIIAGLDIQKQNIFFSQDYYDLAEGVRVNKYQIMEVASKNDPLFGSEIYFEYINNPDSNSREAVALKNELLNLIQKFNINTEQTHVERLNESLDSALNLFSKSSFELKADAVDRYWKQALAGVALTTFGIKGTINYIKNQTIEQNETLKDSEIRNILRSDRLTPSEKEELSNLRSEIKEIQARIDDNPLDRSNRKNMKRLNSSIKKMNDKINEYQEKYLLDENVFLNNRLQELDMLVKSLPNGITLSGDQINVEQRVNLFINNGGLQNDLKTSINILAYQEIFALPGVQQALEQNIIQELEKVAETEKPRPEAEPPIPADTDDKINDLNTTAEEEQQRQRNEELKDFLGEEGDGEKEPRPEAEPPILADTDDKINDLNTTAEEQPRPEAEEQQRQRNEELNDSPGEEGDGEKEFKDTRLFKVMNNEMSDILIRVNELNTKIINHENAVRQFNEDVNNVRKGNSNNKPDEITAAKEKYGNLTKEFQRLKELNDEILEEREKLLKEIDLFNKSASNTKKDYGDKSNSLSELKDSTFYKMPTELLEEIGDNIYGEVARLDKAEKNVEKMSAEANTPEPANTEPEKTQLINQKFNSAQDFANYINSQENIGKDGKVIYGLVKDSESTQEDKYIAVMVELAETKDGKLKGSAIYYDPEKPERISQKSESGLIVKSFNETLTQLKDELSNSNSDSDKEVKLSIRGVDYNLDATEDIKKSNAMADAFLQEAKEAYSDKSEEQKFNQKFAKKVGAELKDKQKKYNDEYRHLKDEIKLSKGGKEDIEKSIEDFKSQVENVEKTVGNDNSLTLQQLNEAEIRYKDAARELREYIGTNEQQGSVSNISEANTSALEAASELGPVFEKEVLGLQVEIDDLDVSNLEANLKETKVTLDRTKQRFIDNNLLEIRVNSTDELKERLSNLPDDDQSKKLLVKIEGVKNTDGSTKSAAFVLYPERNSDGKLQVVYFDADVQESIPGNNNENAGDINDQHSKVNEILKQIYNADAISTETIALTGHDSDGLNNLPKDVDISSVFYMHAREMAVFQDPKTLSTTAGQKYPKDADKLEKALQEAQESYNKISDESDNPGDDSRTVGGDGGNINEDKVRVRDLFVESREINYVERYNNKQVIQDLIEEKQRAEREREASQGGLEPEIVRQALEEVLEEEIEREREKEKGQERAPDLKDRGGKNSSLIEKMRKEAERQKTIEDKLRGKDRGKDGPELIMKSSEFNNDESNQPENQPDNFDPINQDEQAPDRSTQGDMNYVGKYGGDVDVAVADEDPDSDEKSVDNSITGDTGDKSLSAQLANQAMNDPEAKRYDTQATEMKEAALEEARNVKASNPLGAGDEELFSSEVENENLALQRKQERLKYLVANGNLSAEQQEAAHLEYQNLQDQIDNKSGVIATDINEQIRLAKESYASSSRQVAGESALSQVGSSIVMPGVSVGGTLRALRMFERSARLDGNVSAKEKEIINDYRGSLNFALADGIAGLGVDAYTSSLKPLSSKAPKFNIPRGAVSSVALIGLGVDIKNLMAAYKIGDADMISDAEVGLAFGAGTTALALTGGLSASAMPLLLPAAYALSKTAAPLLTAYKAGDSQEYERAMRLAEHGADELSYKFGSVAGASHMLGEVVGKEGIAGIMEEVSNKQLQIGDVNNAYHSMVMSTGLKKLQENVFDRFEKVLNDNNITIPIGFGPMSPSSAIFSNARFQSREKSKEAFPEMAAQFYGYLQDGKVNGAEKYLDFFEANHKDNLAEESYRKAFKEMRNAIGQFRKFEKYSEIAKDNFSERIDVFREYVENKEYDKAEQTVMFLGNNLQEMRALGFSEEALLPYEKIVNNLNVALDASQKQDHIRELQEQYFEHFTHSPLNQNYLDNEGNLKIESTGFDDIALLRNYTAVAYLPEGETLGIDLEELNTKAAEKFGLPAVNYGQGLNGEAEKIIASAIPGLQEGLDQNLGDLADMSANIRNMIDYTEEFAENNPKIRTLLAPQIEFLQESLSLVTEIQLNAEKGIKDDNGKRVTSTSQQAFLDILNERLELGTELTAEFEENFPAIEFDTSYPDFNDEELTATLENVNEALNGNIVNPDNFDNSVESFSKLNESASADYNSIVGRIGDIDKNLERLGQFFEDNKGQITASLSERMQEYQEAMLSKRAELVENADRYYNEVITELEKGRDEIILGSFELSARYLETENGAKIWLTENGEVSAYQDSQGNLTKAEDLEYPMYFTDGNGNVVTDFLHYNLENYNGSEGYIIFDRETGRDFPTAIGESLVTNGSDFRSAKKLGAYDNLINDNSFDLLTRNFDPTNQVSSEESYSRLREEAANLFYGGDNELSMEELDGELEQQAKDAAMAMLDVNFSDTDNEASKQEKRRGNEGRA